MSSLISAFVEVDGLRLHYLDGGEGDVVLLLHGWPTSSFLYRNVAQHIIDAGRRVIALDLPGFGRSDKPLDASYSFRFFDRTLSGFLDALGVEQTGLVVHDLGGPVGLHWMVENPARVSSVALLNTLIYPRPSWAVVAFVVASYIPLLRGLLVSPWGLKVAMQIGTFSERGRSAEVVAGVQAPFVDRSARKALLKAAHGLHPGGMKTIATKLPQTTVPVRLIYGARDWILPDVPKTFPRLARELGLATDAVTALEGCGHFLQEDRPDEVGRLLAEFFRR